LCRENGTVIDDLIAYKISKDKILICVNASNIEKDWKWISSQKANFNCKLSNHSDDYSLIALQGPKSIEVLKAIGFSGPEKLEYYSLAEMKYENETVIVARTGYTGEDGFELFSSHTMALKLWERFAKAGVKPCGLASRDVLRLEVCYPLYGHELNDELTPLDSGLKWTVKAAKEKFIGKAALENYKPKLQLIKLSLEKGIPRDNYEIFNEAQQLIGKVTSGTMSVALNKGICFALVEKGLTSQKYFVKIRENLYEATKNDKAFITGGHK
jgi:aminomethyltransferase